MIYLNECFVLREEIMFMLITFDADFVPDVLRINYLDVYVFYL